MKYLKLSKTTGLYFEHLGVVCINNAEGVSYISGSMRNIAAATSKIMKENKGARVQCMTTTMIKIVKEEHAIMEACVIFNLTNLVEQPELEDDSTNEKKVKITDSVKLFCKNHDITLVNNSEGAVYFCGSMRDISAAISKILEGNKDLHVQCLTSALVRTEKNEQGKENAIVNACVIFDYWYKRSKKQN